MGHPSTEANRTVGPAKETTGRCSRQGVAISLVPRLNTHGPVLAPPDDVDVLAELGPGGVPPSRRRDCHLTDTPSPSLLKHLLKVEGVQQNGSLADG